MKQYIVINDDLKMSKGKIARVCHTAGTLHKKVSSFVERILWNKNHRTTIVLKANKFQYDKLKTQLKYCNIKYAEHIDAGKTQVPEGSSCMLTFFSDNGSFTMSLKLY